MKTTGFFTDSYELAMAAAYLRDGRQTEPAAFDYFFRTLPFGGGFVIFAGLADFLQALREFRFDEEELSYLRASGYPEPFLAYLREFRFCGRIFAPREGEPVFPVEPIVRVEGGLIEAQIIETLLLNFLNFQSLIATKAARVRHVAGERRLSEFGLRRAQGIGGHQASRAAVVGGCDSTSNLEAARRYGFPAAGTMAHSFVQSYPDELAAFRQFAEVHRSRTVLLLDTYDTLHSGLPHAITVAREFEKKGERLAGVRLDSGDLAYLASAVRDRLDTEGLGYVQIVASNQLDEYVVRSLLEQSAPIDIFGVGTALATGAPDGALDGIYKLAMAGGSPRMKFSETVTKATLPGMKMVSRFRDEQGNFVADAIHLSAEPPPVRMVHPFESQRSFSLDGFESEPLLQPVWEGSLIGQLPSALEAAAYARTRLRQLPPEHQRFENPHTYKVGISEALRDLRDRLRLELSTKFETP